jgi:FKBP-type peptidyl-prolyl cis-trans isomerase
MLKRTVPSLCSILMLVLVPWGLSCAPETKKSESTKPKADDGKDDSKAMSMEEVVFDPRNPPAGFGKCHRNHCHRIGGGVASYQQVMQEIGATKAINVPKPKPMPKAPSDVASVPADAQKTKSGLATKVLKPGQGKKPTLASTVVVHYTAWTAVGKGFDSSVARGEPAMIPLSKLNIKGLSEALLLMSAGEQRRLWLPEELAFEGRRGKPSGMIVFDVQLLEVM